MKRELKGSNPSPSEITVLDRKAHPDEKGTERLDEISLKKLKDGGSQGPSR